MMIKIFLISACVAASANADWEWKENDNNPSGSRIRRMQADAYSQFANIADFPNIPDMHHFDNLYKLNFPEIKIPDIKMPEIKMPEIKMPEIEIPEIEIPEIEIPEIKIPDIKMSPEDIASHKEPGYTGVSVVTINSKTVVTINEGGNVKTYTVPAGSSKEKTSSILAGTAVNN